jgi:hypothetical protein
MNNAITSTSSYKPGWNGYYAFCELGLPVYMAALLLPFFPPFVAALDAVFGYGPVGFFLTLGLAAGTVIFAALAHDRPEFVPFAALAFGILFGIVTHAARMAEQYWFAVIVIVLLVLVPGTVLPRIRARTL